MPFLILGLLSLAGVAVVAIKARGGTPASATPIQSPVMAQSGGVASTNATPLLPPVSGSSIQPETLEQAAATIAAGKHKHHKK